MDGGCSVYAYPIKCYFKLSEDADASARSAFVVPKKRFPRAVDRNRVKRLMRETYRLQKAMLRIPEGNCCRMCWISVAKEMPSYEIVHDAAATIFRKINAEISQSDEKVV